MTTNTEDIFTCVREGRTPRAHGPYRIEVGDKDLSFTAGAIDDPVPTGRQIIESIGIWNAENNLIFQVLRNGELEELRRLCHRSFVVSQ